MPTPNSESELLEIFERVLVGVGGSHMPDSHLILRELDGLHGRADLVSAQIKALPHEVDPSALATSLRSPTKARLLSILRYGAPRTRSFLERAAGIPNRYLGRYIRDLEAAGLALVHENSSVSLGCRLSWDMVDIVTYEAKLTNWRRALHQALGYRSFSRSVSVVMPSSAARQALKLATVFHNNGIGLIAIRDDGSPNIEIRPKRHRRPTSRRIYLMAVGLVVTKYLEKEGIQTPTSDLNRLSASSH